MLVLLCKHIGTHARTHTERSACAQIQAHIKRFTSTCLHAVIMKKIIAKHYLCAQDYTSVNKTVKTLGFCSTFAKENKHINT